MNSPDVGQLVLDCRMGVCAAYYNNGRQAALIAVAGASMMLAPLVAGGELLPADAWDVLQEVAENLTLVESFGQDAVQEAIAFGPRVFASQVRRAA